MIIEVDLKFDIKVELLHDFTLSGGVANMNMNVTGLKTYFKTNVAVSDLDTKLQALEQPDRKSVV